MSELVGEHMFSVAYSSDSDDALMVWALQRGVENAFSLEDSSEQLRTQSRTRTGSIGGSSSSYIAQHCAYVSEEIEELNRKSFLGTYEVSALSAAVFPEVKDRYQLLGVGMSFASSSLGPSIVVRRDSSIHSVEDLCGKVVAVPGRWTSAYATARMCIGDFTPYFSLFSDISQNILACRCDAGILIHEEQLHLSSKDLRVVGHLGDIWSNYSGYQHLPLGVIGIKRQLSEATKRWLSACYLYSIRYGLKHADSILPKILHDLKHNQGMVLPQDKAAEYISQYVAGSAVALSAEQKESLAFWFEKGKECGLWQSSFHWQEDVVDTGLPRLSEVR